MSIKLSASYTLMTIVSFTLNDRSEVKYSITHRHDKFVGVSVSRQSIADVILKIVADLTLGSRDSLGIADPATDGF